MNKIMWVGLVITMAALSLLGIAPAPTETVAFILNIGAVIGMAIFCYGLRVLGEPRRKIEERIDAFAPRLKKKQ